MPFQLVPLDIPPHLIHFFCKKLGTSVEQISENSFCTTSVIDKYSLYAEKIFQNIKPATYKKVPSVSFYIKLSNTIYLDYRHLPDGRYTYYTFNNAFKREFLKLFRELLKLELVAYVDGALFSYQALKGTHKGITHKAIREFMIKNEIPFTSTSFENLRKIQYRSKLLKKQKVI